MSYHKTPILGIWGTDYFIYFQEDAMKKRSAAAAVIAALILIMSVCLSGCGTKTLLSENDPVTLEFCPVELVNELVHR